MTENKPPVTGNSSRRSKLDIFTEVDLWWDNPRLYEKGLTANSTQDEIEAAIFEDPDVEELYTTIVSDGFLMEEPEVFRTAEGRLAIGEGNSRIACRRRAFRNGKMKSSQEWFKEISVESLDARLHQYHNVGKNKWTKPNQIRKLYRTAYGNNPSPEEFEKRLHDQCQRSGTTLHELKKSFQALELYEEHIVDNGGKPISQSLFVLYEVALGLKKSGIREMVMDRETRKEFDSWYQDGRVTNTNALVAVAGFWNEPVAKAMFREGSTIEEVKEFIRYDNADVKAWLRSRLHQAKQKINEVKLRASANDAEWRDLLNDCSNFFAQCLDDTEVYANEQKAADDNSANHECRSSKMTVLPADGCYSFSGSINNPLSDLFRACTGIDPDLERDSQKNPDMRDMFIQSA